MLQTMTLPTYIRTSMVHLTTLCVSLFGSISFTAVAEDMTVEQREYFEQFVRPVLVQNCYECHGADPEEIEADFNLTFRDGIRGSGSFGSNLVPGDVSKSDLVEALRYEDPEFQMPPTGKLPDLSIEHIEKWIEMGAPDPRDKPFVAGEQSEDDLWAETLKRRKQWWSFQPILDPTPPESTADESIHPIDRFVYSGLLEAGLEPAPRADDRVLVRRLYYVLIGLPPTPEQVNAFLGDAAKDRQATVESTVDQLLASPQFGERWARHWMDWVRYSETHGSEGDPSIPHAWKYRDYLIRALNSDVPYDQLVREHLAGDLIANPRINTGLELNESALGIAHYRFVQHGYSPTDALEERIRFTDNQIDVVSKAFLGLTVSCARCHDHKFDPISQKDYYGLYGIMASTRPATIVVDMPDRGRKQTERLVDLKPRIRTALAEEWLNSLDSFADRLQDPPEHWPEVLEEEVSDTDPFYPWKRMSMLDGDSFSEAWDTLELEWRASREDLASYGGREYLQRWDLSNDEDTSEWYRHGNGLPAKPTPAGEFHVSVEGDHIVLGIYPAGVYSHGLSTKHSGVFGSPRFDINGTRLYVRVIGGGGAPFRYVVQNYPQGIQLYPMKRLGDEIMGWQEFDTEYWLGDTAHFEISTAADQPLRLSDYKSEFSSNTQRSWFGITEMILAKEGQPAPRDEVAEFVSPLFELSGTPLSADELAHRYADALRTCVEAWRDGTMTDEQARFLDAFVRRGLLPNSLDDLETLRPLVGSYREAEAKVPIPIRAPGILEEKPIDQVLYTRGNHRTPADPVPRSFLSALDPEPYDSDDAGRMELADDILDHTNPLTARVAVNRLWRNAFGLGIVSTPDNFGALGEVPSHPELLDHLASQFVRDGWSIKDMLKYFVTSQTFQRSSEASDEASLVDPDNRLLSHARVRRLEAEAIRDTLLFVAARLDLEMYGFPASDYLGRRSVYSPIRRNRLDPLLTAFDALAPISTLGHRVDTNVPAQSLMLMNDPFVADLALAFADRVLEDESLREDQDRIDGLFQIAFGRRATQRETARAQQFMDEVRQMQAQERKLEGDVWREALVELQDEAEGLHKKASKDAPDPSELVWAWWKSNPTAELSAVERKIRDYELRLGEPNPWPVLAHSVFNLKEFIYLQ